MKLAAVIELVLFLLEGAARFTRPTADEKIIGEIREAISALNKVHGSIVTREQLDGLRTTIQWPDLPASGSALGNGS